MTVWESVAGLARLRATKMLPVVLPLQARIEHAPPSVNNDASGRSCSGLPPVRNDISAATYKRRSSSRSVSSATLALDFSGRRVRLSVLGPSF
jgi:hypothetical protein